MARAASLHATGRGSPRGSAALLRLRGDDALVERARAGDEVAFEVLYERHVPGVLSFCRHMLGSREEGEDAVQQAFTSAHRELVSGSARELRFKPWIYTVARNRCISIIRGRHIDTVELHDVPSTAGLAEEVATRAELRELLADLADLGVEQRAALVLTELGDLSHAEVAAVLDRDEQSVKGLVFRARAALSERRDARDAECDEIRAQIAIARGGALRRGLLKHHLSGCPDCSKYLEDLRNQRRMLAVVLPVAPSIGLKGSVMAATGIGAATGGGAALTAGIGATIAKVAAVAVLAGGAGVAGERVIDHQGTDRAAPAAVAPGVPSSLSTTPLSPPAAQGRGPVPKAVARRRAAKTLGRAPAPARRKAVTPAPAVGGAPDTPVRRGPVNRPPRVKPDTPGRSEAAPGKTGSAPGRPADPGSQGVRAQGAPAPPAKAKPDKAKTPE